MSTLSSSIVKHAKLLFEGQKGDHGDFNAFLADLSSGALDALTPETLDAGHPLSHYYISSSHNTYLSGNQLYGHASHAPYQHVLERGCRCVEIDVWDGVDASTSDSESEQDSGKHGRFRDRLSKGFHKLKLEASDEVHPPTHQTDAAPPSSSPPRRIKQWHAGRIEPRVLHGHTATKDVSFRRVCEAIRQYAFKNSDLPIIVSLEIHTSPEQQEIMVEIMRDEWGDHLVDRQIVSDDMTPLPTLESLRRKILIKVKYSMPKSRKSRPGTAQSTNSAADSSEDDTQLEGIKKGSIIEALGSMGVYTRSCHFKGFTQPEAKLPTHIFALSEAKVIDIQSRDPLALFKHNKSFLMRAYPKGARVSSSNLDPAPFWRQGIQMVALNWQYINAAMMLNQAMFQGTGGWVLKPPGYHPDHTSAGTDDVSAHSMIRGTLNLNIEVFAGQNIGNAAKHKKLKPYIRCELHVEEPKERRAGGLRLPSVVATEASGYNTVFGTPTVQSKDGEFKTRTTDADNIGRDPDFAGQKLWFRDIAGVVEDLTFVRFKVMHDDLMTRDDLVAWACFRVSRIRGGIRTIRLFDDEGEMTDGRLLVRVTKTFLPDK